MEEKRELDYPIALLQTAKFSITQRKRLSTPCVLLALPLKGNQSTSYFCQLGMEDPL